MTDSTQPLPPAEARRRYQQLLPTDQIAAMNVLFDLRAAVQRIDNMLSRWLGDDALSPGRFQVLIVLWAASEPVLQRDIVKALQVSRATVSELVESLAAEGYLSTAQSPDDKRQVLVELSAMGREATARIVRANAARLRAAFGGLTDEDLRTLSATLMRLDATRGG